MAATMRIPTEFTAVDKFTSVVSKMASGVSNFTKTAGSAVQRLNSKISSGFEKLGRIGQMILGVSLGGLFALAIQNNVDYNDSLMSVSAITGATGNELANLESQAMKTAKAQKMLGSDVFKAYELIASAKPELLQNTKLLDEVTNATARLSKAARMEMADAATSVTTSLNQFGLGGEHALKVVDNLAAGTVYGASSIQQTSDALSKFGTIAAATGTKVDESIALIQLVSPFEKGAEAGIKLRNVLGKMASAKILPKDAQKQLAKYGVNTKILSDATLPLSVRLKEMAKVGKDTTAVMQIFGTENAALAQAVFNNVDSFDEMLKNVNSVGKAEEMAAANTNTLRHGIDSIKTSFLNATTATNSGNSSFNMLKDTLFFLANNMETVLSVIASLVVGYGALQAVLIASKIAVFAQSVAMGVSAASTGAMSIAMKGNTVAIAAYNVATWTATASATAFATAVNLGLWPILLIIAAIAAIIAIFYYWDEIVAWFSKQWEKFTNWIGELWNGVVKWFEEFDFVDFFMMIGQAIIDFMLMPLKSLLKLVAMIPGGIGEAAQMGLDKLNEMTDLSMMLNTENSQVESPEEVQSQNMQKNTLNGSLDIMLKDKGGNVDSVKNNSNGFIPVNVTSTQGAF